MFLCFIINVLKKKKKTPFLFSPLSKFLVQLVVRNSMKKSLFKI